MRPEFAFEGGEYFALRFPYDGPSVARVRALKNRRWNKTAACWEVHISHLGQVIQIFNLTQRDVDRGLVHAYHVYRIKHLRTQIEAGPVMARVTGENLPVKKIDDATSFNVPGYQYMPRYLDGFWDGKRHLFDRRRQTFPTGLLGRVLKILDHSGVQYQMVEENAPAGPAGLPGCRAPAIKLREYQRECVAAALDKRRGVIELATGAGKTAVAAVIIHKLAMPAVFFVHTRDLLHQTADFLAGQLGIGVGRVGDGLADIQPVTVATVQTCSRALGMKVAPDAEGEPLEADETPVDTVRDRIAEMVRRAPVIFFDECHHLPADTFYSLAMEAESAWVRLGLSATPHRCDGQDLLLEAALGPKLFSASASALIDKGFLVPPRIRFLAAPQIKFDARAGPDFRSVFDACIVENEARHKVIAEEARRLAARGSSVLVLVSQVRHGQALREHMPEAPMVQGSETSAARRKVFKSLEAKKTRVVIATTLADEGLDIPSLDAVILASGGKSETRALQRVGRVLRPSPGKEEAVIIDFFDNAPFLAEHGLRRLDIYEAEPRFAVETVGFKP